MIARRGGTDLYISRDRSPLRGDESGAEDVECKGVSPRGRRNAGPVLGGYALLLIHVLRRRVSFTLQAGQGQKVHKSTHLNLHGYRMTHNNNTQDDTPPRTIFEANFLDDGENFNAERCVY